MLGGRFCRSFEHLESRCPDLIPNDRWQQALQDSRSFLAQWGGQAEALGWTAPDLFGLSPLPDNPHPSYWRLSRYDETGLTWLLRGRPVLALTESTAAVESPTGAITVYHRHNKPALGPLGDSLEDLSIRAAKQVGATEVEVRIGDRSAIIIRIAPSTGMQVPLEESAEIVL